MYFPENYPERKRQFCEIASCATFAGFAHFEAKMAMCKNAITLVVKCENNDGINGHFSNLK
jgi:hypothetical protein